MTVGNNDSTKSFPASLDHLYAMLQFICSNAVHDGFDEMELAKIELACEEALVNIISYAYPEKGIGEIEITCLIQDNQIEIRLKDQGVPYDPVSNAATYKQIMQNPDPIELRKLGGYGIFFILTLMDEVSYKREGDNNVLTMVKKKTSKNLTTK